MNQGQPIYTVTQANNYIKNLLDGDRQLGGIFIRGELSNYKMYPSGHHYFSLKDESGALRGVMFRREALGLKFQPKSGMKVIAYGRITVFPRDGQYQLYCNHLTPDGIGELHIAFEQLKERLHQEGLFDPGHKRPIPKYPRKIALITSPAGAAIQDMLRVLGARFPLAEVLVLPVRVQGTEAAGEIAAAIQYANQYKLADLIITGRGGGSMEDLWCFNEEVVARAIYHCEIPIISAVGHEPDVTIADFVADLRAATPSNGAELAVPDQNDLYATLGHLEDRLLTAMEHQCNRKKQRLQRLGDSPWLQSPLHYIEGRRLALAYQGKGLYHGFDQLQNKQHQRFARLAASLDALSPLKVLGRGYALTQSQEGQILTSIQDVNLGDTIAVQLTDGTLDCTVDHRRKAKWQRKK